jgi:hypothetical protein
MGDCQRETAMSNKSIATITTIAIDIGKNSFHVVSLDRRGVIALWQNFVAVSDHPNFIGLSR